MPQEYTKLSGQSPNETRRVGSQPFSAPERPRRYPNLRRHHVENVRLSRGALRCRPCRASIPLNGTPTKPTCPPPPAPTAFRQNQPHEGQPATQRTEVRFVFDG